MKTAIFLANDFSEGNGANARIKAYAKGLKAKGVEVELLFLHASSFNNTHVNNRVTGQWAGIFFKFLNGRCTRPVSVVGKIWDSLKALVGSTRYLLKHHQSFDHFYIYAPKFHQFFHIFLIARLLGKPTIVERTELYSALYEGDKSWKATLLRKMHQWDEHYCHHFCTHLVVISSRLYHFYRQYFTKDRITQIPIIVDLERFNHHNGHPAKPYRVGYLGSFGGKDGVSGIIKAFAGVREKAPGLQLRLMGYNHHFREYNQEIINHGIEGAVEHLGQVKYSAIPGLLQQCDLLIVNCTNDPYAHYGFPTKLGEYLATGIPTVVTNVGDVPKYLTHQENAWVIEPENSTALAKAIHKRYQHYEFFSKIGQQGKELAREVFDYRIHVSDLYQLLERLKSDKEKIPVAGKIAPIPEEIQEQAS